DGRTQKKSHRNAEERPEPQLPRLAHARWPSLYTLYHSSHDPRRKRRTIRSEVSTTQGGVSMRAFGRLAAASVLVFAAAGAVAHATVIYVNAAASGANNGTSWANAFTTLPPALSAAGATDEIWVAQATYKPTATTTRTISFALKDGVSVYGGFVGNETQRTQRDPVAHVTVLSGDIG